MKITQYTVNRPLATFAILSGLIVLGIYGLFRLPVDFLPDITYPAIKVHIAWRGATPEEIEKNIAEPLEQQMATVDNLDTLETSIIEGTYSLNVNFRYGTNIDVAYQDVVAVMGRVTRGLPSDIDPPFVFKADPSLLPIAQITVSSDELGLVKLREWTENWLQPQMIALSGVAGTEIVGGLKREIRVNLDIATLEKYGLTIPGILKRLAEENIEEFGGRVTDNEREFIVRTTGEFTSIENIRSLAIKQTPYGVLYLKDIAQVEDSNEDVRIITRLNGQPCVKLSILKQADANTVEVAGGVRNRTEQLKPILPEGLKLEIVENQADYIESALAGVRNTAIIAALLVIFVTYFFFGHLWQVGVMILALPITLILNFGLMKMANFSVNIFTLGGLVVAIAVLLSNTIVVVENITRRKHAARKRNKDSSLIIFATEEVGAPIIAATTTFVFLLLPFLIVPGITSLLFRELVMVIGGIILVSLLVAISVTPLLSFEMMGHKVKDLLSPFEKFFNRTTERYKKTLAFLLGKRHFVFLFFGILLMFSVYIFQQLGTEFLPLPDDGRVMVKVKMPTGTSVRETDRILEKVEKILAEDNFIEYYFTLAGGLAKGLYTYEIANEGEVNIQLIPRNQRSLSTQGYVEQLRSKIAKIPVPGGKLGVSQKKISGIRQMGTSDIDVEIKGDEIEQLFVIARETAEVVNSLPELTNVNISIDMTKPEYQVILDRTKIADMGITTESVSQMLRALIAGAIPTRYREGGEYYNIRVIVPEKKLSSMEDIENLPVATTKGRYTRLSDIAEVKAATGPVEISRKNQIKTVSVVADTAGVSIGQSLGKLKNAIASVEFPAGYEYTFGGQAQMIAEMRITILAIIAFAVFFSFIVLAVQFNSFKLPGLIIACIPFCLSGMAYMMFVSGLSIGATVIIGLLVVIAALANDGVLLLSFTRLLHVSGDSTSKIIMIPKAKMN